MVFLSCVKYSLNRSMVAFISPTNRGCLVSSANKKNANFGKVCIGPNQQK